MDRAPKRRTVARTDIGLNVTPRDLATLTDVQTVALSLRFGEYFRSQAPTADKITDAIAHILARWPVGSLGA
jgi:hypothetical protein